MSNKEKINNFFKSKPIDKGSYEVNSMGRITKRGEITPDEDIKNELSYFKSPAREKALNDLDEKIFLESGLSDILNDELVGAFLFTPEQLTDRLERMQEILSDEEFINYIDSLDLRLLEIIPLLEEKKDWIINERLDYKNFGDYAVDRDIKSEYEKLIDYINIFIERAKLAREYIKDKKINF